MKKSSLALLWLLLLPIFCPAQYSPLTNTLTGSVGSFNLAGRTNISVTMQILWPINRTINNTLISNDPIQTQTDTNGNFAFTNVQWGAYRVTPADSSGSYWYPIVGTNTTGSWPIASLVNNFSALPPNPSTNYYTQAQINALLSAIELSGGGVGDAGSLSNTNAANLTNSGNEFVGSFNGSISLSNSWPIGVSIPPAQYGPLVWEFGSGNSLPDFTFNVISNGATTYVFEMAPDGVFVVQGGFSDYNDNTGTNTFTLPVVAMNNQNRISGTFTGTLIGNSTGIAATNSGVIWQITSDGRLIETNTANGSYYQVSTNGYIKSVDQYGNMRTWTTNSFTAQLMSGGVQQTLLFSNGVLTINGFPVVTNSTAASANYAASAGTANQVLDPFGNSVLTSTGTNQFNNTNVIYGYGFTVGNGMTGTDLNFNNPLYLYNPPGSSYPAYTNGTLGIMVFYDGAYNSSYVASNSLSPPPWTATGQDRYTAGSASLIANSWASDTGSGGPTGMGFNYGTNYVSTYKITVITATNISIVEAPGVISQSATNAPFSVVNTNGNGGSPQIVLADFHANVWYSANQNQSSLQVQNLGIFTDAAFNAIGPTPGWGNNGMAGVPATPMGGTMYDSVPDVRISYQSYYGGIAGQTAWSSTNNLIDFVGLNMDDTGQTANPNTCATNWIAWNNGNIWATGFGVHTNMFGVGSFWAWYNVTNYLMTWGGFGITDWTNSAGATALAIFGENTGSPATFTKAWTLDLAGNMSISGSYSGNGSGLTNPPGSWQGGGAHVGTNSPNLYNSTNGGTTVFQGGLYGLAQGVAWTNGSVTPFLANGIPKVVPASGIVTLSMTITNAETVFLTNVTSGDCAILGPISSLTTTAAGVFGAITCTTGDTVEITNVSVTAQPVIVRCQFHALR